MNFVAIGRLCEKCDGKCVICDSYVRPCNLVRICDECNYGSYQGRCVICGGIGISDAYYCKECVQIEKDVRKYFVHPPLSDCKIMASPFDFFIDYREMDARKSSTLELQEWTCSMNAKNMGILRVSDGKI